MNYLGDQTHALDIYSKEAICWLSIKIKGRKSRGRPLGYKCSDNNCSYCNSSGKIRAGINQDYRDLFTISLIEEIITFKPKQLIQIEAQLRTNYKALGYTDQDFNLEGRKLFILSGYEDWFLNNKWNYNLATLLDRHTCTYCNREYIFICKNIKGGKGMVPQFDHWFPKTNYPLLALSFYNLIPSCATCNGIKSAVNMNLGNHLHPYLDRDISSLYRFSYLFDSTNSLKIIFKNNLVHSSKPRDTYESLNLEMIYKEHASKELKDLYELRYKYSDNYLKKLLEKTFGNLTMSDQEKYRLIFGIELDRENYHKRIMSKFKNDIISELLNNT